MAHPAPIGMDPGEFLTLLRELVPIYRFIYVRDGN